MEKLMSERDMRLASDVADTILHFRLDCGCFPTRKAMEMAIVEELQIRPFQNKDYGKIMVEDIIQMRGEWFDKECEPE